MEENILQVLNTYETAKNHAAKSILNELKKNCLTYSEVEKNAQDLKREIYYKQDNKEKYSELINLVLNELDKEKNALPLTKHS